MMQSKFSFLQHAEKLDEGGDLLTSLQNDEYIHTNKALIPF